MINNIDVRGSKIRCHHTEEGTIRLTMPVGITAIDERHRNHILVLNETEALDLINMITYHYDQVKVNYERGYRSDF